MITNALPYELTLHILTMFTDIRDIVAFYKSHEDIKKIIIKNLNYVIKSLVNNNKISYPQMSILINSCYYKQHNYKYNMYNMITTSEFISNVSKDIIIEEVDKLEYEINKERRIFENQINIPLSKTNDEIYKMYYHCRIHKNFKQEDAIFASIFLTWNKFIKTNYYVAMKYNPADAIKAALLTDEEVIKLNMLMKKNIDIENALRCVTELSDEDIAKMLSLVNRGISTNNAIDIVEEFEDDFIEIMCNFINEGIEYAVARNVILYPEEYHSIILELNRKKIDMDIIITIIENFEVEQINWFVIMINNDIDKYFALDLIEDNDMDNEKFKEFIELIKIKIECKMARTIVKKFESINIIKFIAIINHNVDVEIAFDVIDLFDDKQITKFLILVNDEFDGNTAYDMVMIYDENQRMMCSIFIKNGISCDLVESYTDEQIKMFIKMFNEDHVDFNTAKEFIDSMERPAKRRR
jgi:hypothetical protein